MEPTAVFEAFILGKGLKHSRPRDWILESFLKIEDHMTVDELWSAVRQRHPSVGHVTVYRTLKLLCEAGLCREIRFDDGTTRFEHSYGHSHHDHIVCTVCGQCIEVVDDDIEELQKRLMKRHGFTLVNHRLNLYGVCRACRSKN